MVTRPKEPTPGVSRTSLTGEAMFCNHCGARLQAGHRFCGSCGRAVVPGPPPAAPVRPVLSRVAGHARTLAVFWIAYSALQLLRGGGRLIGAQFMRHVGFTWWGGAPWGWPVGHFVPAVLSALAMGSLILAVGGFAAGWGLLERCSWGRTLAIAVAIFALFHPLLGTALGVYTLWVLLPRDAEEEWRRATCPA
jgi:zinc-ribbon domain